MLKRKTLMESISSNQHNFLKEIGKTLVSKYGGKFSKVLEKARGDARNLLDIILDSFPSFTVSYGYRSEFVRSPYFRGLKCLC